MMDNVQIIGHGIDIPLWTSGETYSSTYANDYIIITIHSLEDYALSQIRERQNFVVFNNIVMKVYMG
jgi:hypothetical protein